MKEQNYSNHTQIVPGFHFIGYLTALAALVISICKLAAVCGEEGWVYNGLLPVLFSTVILVLLWYSRAFALKAQDRAIRAEENFRHFILTGKPLPSGLRMGQIVALRFASDAEFVRLTERAIAEQLSSKQIKQSIQNWRGDHYRV
jgi:hypothetical protein